MTSSVDLSFDVHTGEGGIHHSNITSDERGKNRLSNYGGDSVGLSSDIMSTDGTQTMTGLAMIQVMDWLPFTSFWLSEPYKCDPFFTDSASKRNPRL